ncbi:MAG: hypothetical protein ACN0LA_03400 [Candidatus Longimicrobiales bacterium M2_2A_002]
MRHPGHTLIETIVALALLAGLLSIAAPAMVRWRDEAAVRSARDELAAALGWTRLAAVSHGGAALVLDPIAARLSVSVVRGNEPPPVDLGRRYGVIIDPGTDRPVVLRYDALGIGRLTSRTIRIRRGAAEVGVTVSAYGRYRRW